MIKTILLAAALATSAMAQTAKVIALDPADAVQAKQLAEEQTALAARVAEFHAAMEKKYTMVAQPAGKHGSAVFSFADGSYYREGWQYGFVYSDDYKYLVPAISVMWAPNAVNY